MRGCNKSLPYSSPANGSGVLREVYTTAWEHLRLHGPLEQKMGELLVFRPAALVLNTLPTTHQQSTAFLCGAFASISILATGHLPYKFSPLQWFWAACHGNTDLLSSPALHEFCPEFAEIASRLQNLLGGEHPTWLANFWSSHVEHIPVRALTTADAIIKRSPVLCSLICLTPRTLPSAAVWPGLRFMAPFWDSLLPLTTWIPLRNGRLSWMAYSFGYLRRTGAFPRLVVLIRNCGLC